MLSWNLRAQIPAECGTPGCNSNDVKIIRAAITDASGQFPVCVGNDPINNLFLHLYVSSSTKRKGVFISATLRITVGSNVQSYPIQHCFSNSLNGDNNDLVVALPPDTYNCGSNVELITVFTAWGTGLSDFCNASTAVQCQGTPSKCRFVPGEVIIVQTTPCTGAVISPQPQNTPACDNGSAFFSVGFTPIANNSTTIKWIVNNNGTWDTIQNNTVYNGATTTTLSILNVNGLNNKEYRAVVINTSTDPLVPEESKVCKTISSSAFLAVDNTSVGGTVTANQTICTGTTPASLTLNGNTGDVVRWERANNVNFTGATNILVTSTTLLATDMGSLTSDTWFRCVVKNGVCPAVNSSSVKVTVDGNPTTATVGTNQERCGSLISLGLGGNSPSTGSGTWTKKFGPGTASFSPSASTANATATVSTAGNYEFTWTITNGVCPTSSADVSVNYYNNPGNLEASVVQPTCTTPSGRITVTSGTSGLTFSLNSTNVNDFTNVDGIFPSLSPGTYLVRSKNSNGCISNSLSKTINAVPGATPAAAVKILTHPSCSSSTGLLKVVKAGSLEDYDNTIFQFSNGGTYGDNPEFSFKAGEGYSINVRRISDPTCLVNTSCAAELQAESLAQKTIMADGPRNSNGENIIIKAYPNPFSDQIKFVVTTQEEGQASLELFNLSGQKIKSVYNGFMSEGVQNFEFTVMQKQLASLVYVFRINGKILTGKLIHAKK